MPWADYACPACYALRRNFTFSGAIGAAASAPPCQRCGETTQVIPMANFDTKSDGGTNRSFQKFSITRTVPTKDGPQQVVEVIDSLHKLRAVERDSEQRFRDGEGEPVRFRMWNENASNKDVNSFGAGGKIGDQVYGEGEKLEKHGRVSVTRHGETEPDLSIGPGMAGAYTPL